MKTKEGGMMDIQEEREAFEIFYKSSESQYHKALDNYDTDFDCYLNDYIQCRYFYWQAAKAQAVPEVLKKFCNEHKDPAWRGRLTEYDKGYSDCCIAVLEMIEAQEPQ